MPGRRFPASPSLPVVQAYRTVAGVTATAEVLSPCGHEVRRFDATPSFVLVQKVFGRPMYPRSRLCPICRRVPDAKVTARVAGPLQLAADWGGLPGGVRQDWAPILNAALEGVPDAPDASRWKELTPQDRGIVALAGEAFARRFGLTFHELLLLKEQSAPTLTTAGYQRLKANSEEKERRIERREAQLRAGEWERKRQ